MEKCLHCGENVSFEIEDGEEICQECGWSKKASAQLLPSQQNGKSFNIKPNRGFVRFVGIILIILGIINLGNPALSFVDIWIGIGLLKFKQKVLIRGIFFQKIQITFCLLMIGIGIFMVSQYTMYYFSYYIITGVIGVIVHGFILVILTRTSVKMAFTVENL